MTSRLPQNYIPTHYDLFIHYLSKPSAFEAKVTITFEKKEGGDQIYLNVYDNITITQIKQNKTELTYTVNYPQLIINRGEDSDFDFTSSPIKIKYTVNPDTEEQWGFFSCGTSYLTDFEPDGARRLFPCFDEPFVKSTFSVKIRIPSSYTGISNMPACKQVAITKLSKEITFQKTPPMCSYLLCICVGKFDFLMGYTKRGIPVTFYYDSDTEYNVELDPEYLQCAIFSIDWMEEHFKVNYELQQLQLISARGYKNAMENYGLITMLEYPADINFECERYIMHEVAHQWFGDLVSIKYWDSLWLNEGFARFLDYCIYIDFQNDDKKVDFFRKNMSIPCIQYFDKGVISLPEDNIIVSFDQLFGLLVYRKGSLVVKMFYDLIGRAQFFDVCSKWLNQYKNKAADLNEFISFVNKELNDDFSQFFDVWLRKSSFPVLMVKEIEHNEETGKFKGASIVQVNPNNVVYQFVVSVAYRNNGEIKKEKVKIMELETKMADIEYDWITVNNDFESLSYVLYSKEILRAMNKFKDEDKFKGKNLEVIFNSVMKNPVPDLIDEEMRELVKIGKCKEWK